MKQNASKHEAQSNKAIFNIGPNIVPYIQPIVFFSFVRVRIWYVRTEEIKPLIGTHTALQNQKAIC